MTSTGTSAARPLALVTGASSGIGCEPAKQQLAGHGFDLRMHRSTAEPGSARGDE